MLIPLYVYHVKQCDPKKCTGQRLTRQRLAAQISKISKIIEFPVVITNQARSFENKIRPFLRTLTSYYLDWHFLFEKSKKDNTITVSLFKKDKSIIETKYSVNSLGFLVDL